VLRDSVLNTDTRQEITRREMQFEFEKKVALAKLEREKEQVLSAAALNRQRVVKNIALAGAIFLLAAGLTIFVFYKRRRDAEERRNTAEFNAQVSDTEMKALRSQMNPHFIFNSLTTIESFVYENQPKEAGKYLSDFARLMRLILENSSEEYIPLNKEIQTLEYYLALQKLRMDNNLTYSIVTDGIEDIHNIDIPPMLTQPFIENAIEHGFRNSTKSGNILIEFSNIDDKQLQIKVTDNGKGIDNEQPADSTNKEAHKSMAINITKERLLVLNKSKKQKVTFVIANVSALGRQATGTEVLFTIPLS
jgi:LytS/YehU family sensor histidine kinase